MTEQLNLFSEETKITVCTMYRDSLAAYRDSCKEKGNELGYRFADDALNKRGAQ